MSLDATRWAWRLQIRSSEKLVALAFADRAGEEHTAWPSILRLTKDTGLNAKTVRGVIRRLEAAGLIRREQRTGSTPIYRLIGVQDRHAEAVQITTVDPSQNRYPTPPKIGTPPLPILVPESTNEPTKNRKNSANALSSASSWKPQPIPDCPHLEIISLYHEILPSLRRVLVSTWPDSPRAKALQARWRENPKHQQLAFWRWLFTHVAKDRFYLGESKSAWRATLGWLVQKNNFDSMLESAVDAQNRSAST